MSARNLLTCLLKFPNEAADAALERVYSVMDIDFGGLQSAYEWICNNADVGVSTTPKMLTDKFGITLDQGGLSPEAYLVYARELRLERLKADATREIANLKVEDASSSILTIAEHNQVGLAQFKQRIAGQAKPRFEFPWPEINSMVPFVHDDDMILITGKSKVGKSSGAHQIALTNARRIPVLYFHNEDTVMKLFMRRIAQLQIASDPKMEFKGLKYADLLNPPANFSKWDAITAAARLGDNLSLTYVYCSGWTPEQITLEWRRFKQRHPLGLVVIDYLNKIEVSHLIKVHGSRAYAFEAAVEMFKREAGRKEAMTNCLLVQQENEEGEGAVRDTKSSYIKAQVHISLQRDEVPGGLLNTGNISVLRANDGITGARPAKFFPEYMLWRCT